MRLGIHPKRAEGNVVEAQAGLRIQLLQQADGRLGGGGGICEAAGGMRMAPCLACR